jgi:hypothetical protein
MLQSRPIATATTVNVNFFIINLLYILINLFLRMNQISDIVVDEFFRFKGQIFGRYIFQQ